ncbi:hypothetical protein ACOWO9_09610 [Leuconostoc mesenteroides]|uniref:hypothetical protein n=1 Tax=Leuconostoc mesenteroides TaxID=1245 RepID=UPI003C4D7E60
MQEYLKKQEVLKSIKPITWLLLIINLVSSGLLILSIFGTVNVVGMLQYILDIIIILSLVELIRISVLQYQLDDNQNYKIKFSQTKFIVIGAVIFIISILSKYLELISSKKINSCITKKRLEK